MGNLQRVLQRVLARYASAFVVLRAQGHLGYAGLGKEETWPTAVAATDWFDLLSENIRTTIDRFPTRNAYGGFYEPDDYAGVMRVAGDIVVAAHPVTIGHFLRAALNTVSQTTVLSGYLYAVHFSSTKSEFADGVPSQPYTLEVHRDTTSSFRYNGAVCNQLVLALAPNQDLRASVSWIARSPGIIAATAPTFPGSPTDPFTFETASLSIGGAATARWESFQLTIANNVSGILALSHSTGTSAKLRIARLRRSAGQAVRIAGTLDFIDHAEYLDFVNQTERQMQLYLTRSASFSFLVDVPRFVYSAFPIGIPGRDRLTVGVEGIARHNVGSALALDITLTTTKSDY